MVKLIVALGPNNLIGQANKLPWHLPKELAHFKKMTRGDALLMGSNTYRGLASDLPGRKLYVLSHRPVEKAVQVPDHDSALALIRHYQNDLVSTLWIAGGKYLYEQFYREASELYITEIHVPCAGDVFIEWDLTNYERELVQSNADFSVYLYQKALSSTKKGAL